MNIRVLACEFAEAAEAFIQKAKRFFYSVMLFCYCCPKCNGSLIMAGEGKCRCVSCSNEFDPTVSFQRCLACGGIPILKVRRYQCRNCGSDIQSRFLFDGLVFDAEYFRQRMAETRQRKQEQRERVKQMLAESRSNTLSLESADLGSVPGLIETLNALTAGLAEGIAIEVRDGFDLKRYESHIKAHIGFHPVSLADIPPLNEDSRRDLIWRFIAVIFLTHAGTIDVMQHGQEILVMKHETNRERRGVPGEPEESDGIEGSVGGVEAW